MTAIWQPAYVGVGSNLDRPRERVLEAIGRLASIPRTRLLARSALYGSKPLGPIAQPDFVNAAAGLLTQLSPRELLAELQGLEIALGRPSRHERWGPRVIDFDLLVFGRVCIDEAGLKVPHPGLAERSFVLRPLADVAPDLDVPGVGIVRQLAARANEPPLWVLADAA